MHRLGAVGVLLAFVLAATATPAEAHGVFFSRGVAEKDLAQYQLTVLRFTENDGSTQFRVTITDLLDESVVYELAAFEGLDNWEDEAVVQAYHAESADSAVDFLLDGVQEFETVWATGHFNGYALAIVPAFV